MNLVIIFITLSLFILIDLYVYKAVKVLSVKWPSVLRKGFYYFYWGLTVLTSLAVVAFAAWRPEVNDKVIRNFILLVISLNYIPKLFSVVILMVSDLVRGVSWLWKRYHPNVKKRSMPGKPMPRSEFIVKAAMLGAGIPFVTMSFGILSGAYDYRVKRQTVTLKGLPAQFDGLTLGQISDIHSGSFYNQKAVQGGIDILNAEKPDLVCFTGDLVNVESSEIRDYYSVFNSIKSDMGVYSVTGNHDYGDYRSWPSAAAKRKNFEELVRAHNELGWDLMLNENRMIEVDGEKLGIIGVENWGSGRFSKYGDLSKAYQGMDEIPAKILLSHDPSHWEAEVLKDYPDIDLVLAGHTHGFQFGVEIGNIRWSPAQYRYKQWAGLYMEGDQHIYVNRGYGFIGYPGRVGIPPEITILTLKSAA